jgi:hypothetical protein
MAIGDELDFPPQAPVSALCAKSLCSARRNPGVFRLYWLGLFDAITVTGVSR